MIDTRGFGTNQQTDCMVVTKFFMATHQERVELLTYLLVGPIDHHRIALGLLQAAQTREDVMGPLLEMKSFKMFIEGEEEKKYASI